MQILLGEDTPAHRSDYHSAMGRALARNWEAAGHDVFRARPDCLRGRGQSNKDNLRVLAHDMLSQAPDAAVCLLSSGPFAEALAAGCLRQERPYISACDAGAIPPAHGDNFGEQLRRIHAGARLVLCPGPGTRDRLQSAGLDTGHIISGGVDTSLFQPRVYSYLDLPRPITLLLGAPLNSPLLREFMNTALPGSQLVYAPEWTGTEDTGSVRFLGFQQADDLARLISAADVCVVPTDDATSLLDSLKSLACGVPIAGLPGAYSDISLQAEAVGAMDSNLGRAVTQALGSNRQLCRSVAKRRDWERVARKLLKLARGPEADQPDLELGAAFSQQPGSRTHRQTTVDRPAPAMGPSM